MAYSVKKWAKVKVEYETSGVSAEKLREKHGISTRSIEYRIQKEKWKKGKNKKIVEEKIEKTTLEMFAEAGMPPSKVIEHMVTGIEKAEDLKFSGPKGEQFCENAPDYKTRLAYIQELNRMVGGHVSKTSLVTRDAKGRILTKTDEITNMANESQEDKDKRLARIRAANESAENDRSSD